MAFDHRALQQRLDAAGYIAEDSLAMALTLAIDLQRPLLLEGEAGVGKTEVGKALARVLGARLIACNAMRASTPARRSTSGTTSASSSPSAPMKPKA